MRVVLLATLVAFSATAPLAVAQSANRYGSAPSSSSSRFDDLFSAESSRTPPASTPKSQPPAGRGNTYELRSLEATGGTATNAPKPSAAPSQRTPGAAAPARTLSPPDAASANSRAGRYDRSQSGRAPSRAYTPRSAGAAGRGPSERSITVGKRREEKTHAMLSDMLKAPANSRLRGTPTPLAAVLRHGATREDQGRLVDAYWALASAATDYYLGLAEADELGRLRQRVPTYSAALSEALTGLNTRVDTSLQAAQAAQLRLGRMMGGGARPLPIDVPFCGPYRTRFGEIFPGGGPEEARLLNELLPARLAELQAAAESVERSNNWLAKVAAAGSGGDGAGMIRALELVALNRRAFVQIARDYNLQINRYTQLATPGGRVDTNRLVAMLIRTDAALTGASGGSLASGDGLEFRSGAAASRR